MAIDASVLAFLFDPAASAPLDGDGNPVSNCQQRVEHLIAQLSKAKATLIIPAPALSEVLVYAGSAAPGWLNIINNVRCVRIAPFDTLAAVECATLAHQRLSGGRMIDVTRRKAKFDEQIVAIATVERADEILSDDGHIWHLVGQKMRVRGIGDLPLPPQDDQISMLDQLSAPERPARAIDLDET